MIPYLDLVLADYRQGERDDPLFWVFLPLVFFTTSWLAFKTQDMCIKTRALRELGFFDADF
jgi:hypothetical protein